MDVIITKKGDKSRYVTVNSSGCLVCVHEDGSKQELSENMTNEFDVYAEDDGSLDVFGVNTDGNLLHIRSANGNTTVHTVLENRSDKGSISSVRVFKIYGRYHLFYCINHLERLLVHHIAGYGDYTMEPEVVDRIGEEFLYDIVCDEDKNMYVIYGLGDSLLKRKYTYGSKSFSNAYTISDIRAGDVSGIYFNDKLYVAYTAHDKGRNCVFLKDAEGGYQSEIGVKVHSHTKVALVIQSGKLCVQWVENSMCFATACTEELIKERVKILGRTKGLARLKAVGADTLVSAVAMNLSSRPYGNVEDMITPHQTPKFEYSGEEVDALSRKYMEVLSRKNDFVDFGQELTRIESALERLVMLAESVINEIKSGKEIEEDQ